MKLFFWNWNNSNTIEVIDLPENPFMSEDYANSQDCFESFTQAKKAALEDLDSQIAFLQETKKDIERMASKHHAVESHYIKGL